MGTDTITRIYAGDIAKVDETPEGLMVSGLATSSTLDLDQQRCNAKWLRSAIPSWFEYTNVREQHGQVAAGVGREVAEGDRPGDWHLKALVVDQNSQNKVRAKVLKGFSIGIKGTQVIKTKEAPNGEIVGGKIVEISLVDRPCNPDCMIGIAKAADGDGAWEPVMAGEVVWSENADGTPTTKAVSLDAPTEADTKALNGQTDPDKQMARNASKPCPECGGDGVYAAPANAQVCRLCGGTGQVPMNPEDETPDGSVPGPETGTPSAQATPKSAEPDALPDDSVTVEKMTTPDGSQTAYKATHGPTGISAAGVTEEAARSALAADVAKGAATAPAVVSTGEVSEGPGGPVTQVILDGEKTAGMTAPATSDTMGETIITPKAPVSELIDGYEVVASFDSPAEAEKTLAGGLYDQAEYAVHENHIVVKRADAEVTTASTDDGQTGKGIDPDDEKHATPKVACPTCKGKGKIKAGKVDCPTCHGDKVVTQAVADKTTGDKKAAKAEKSAQPVPELTAGSQLARAFLRTTAALKLSAADAVEALAEVSKALEAEVLKGTDCATCEGAGVLKVKDQCSKCKGTGRADGDDCPACDGKGILKTQETCPDCDGSGNATKGAAPDDSDPFAVQVGELDPAHEDYLTRLGALKATAKTMLAEDEKAELPAAVVAFDPSEDDPDELVDLAKKQFSDKERVALAAKGGAIPVRNDQGDITSGAFPIDDVASLKDAIQAIGRAKDPAVAKAHIEKMAKKLGREDLIPDGWKAVEPDDEKAAAPGTWVHDPAVLAQTRNNIAQLMQAELDELMQGECEIGDLYDLLATLCSFLGWWQNEAMGGEDPSPFQVNDDTEDAVIWTSMGIEPDTIKAASDDTLDEDARAEAQKRLRKQVRKALGLNKTQEFDDSQKAVIADTAKAIADEALEAVMERLQTVEKMAAPGGPKRSRTREEDTKATRKDELEVEINATQKSLDATNDPELTAGYRERLVNLRAEQRTLTSV